MRDNLVKLREMREKAIQGGGPKRIEQQHAKGKLTARERLALLLDQGSFQEFGALATPANSAEEDQFPGDGVITGLGRINGRRVAVFAQDFTVLGGSFGTVQSNKICRIQDMAMNSGIPLIGLNDSGGARIQEGVASLAAYGEVFVRNVLASGVIPQISVIMGPCAGGAVYSPALTDFVIMVEDTSFMFLTGPEVIKTVTGRDVTVQDLGGAHVHSCKSGVVHRVAKNEHDAIEQVKMLLGYLPQNNHDDSPQTTPYDPPDRMDGELNTIIPEDERTPYDVHDVISRVFDRDSFMEIQPGWAPNAVVGYARLDGFSVGLVANQPLFLAGALDINSSDKIARFTRICDAYNIPIITFVDTPGFMPGIEQEYDGIIRHGAKILYAYSSATVPKISVVLRKAMGGAYVAMSSKQLRCDLNFAWPSAQIAVMGAEGAVQVLRGKEIKNAADPKALEKKLIAEYREKFFNPYRAADAGQIDEVIEPRETRPRLIRALEVLRTKVQLNPSRKHGILPS